MALITPEPFCDRAAARRMELHRVFAMAKIYALALREQAPDSFGVYADRILCQRHRARSRSESSSPRQPHRYRCTLAGAKCTKKPKPQRGYLWGCLELLPGFGPGTSSLPRMCSTSWAIAAKSQEYFLMTQSIITNIFRFVNMFFEKMLAFVFAWDFLDLYVILC